MARKKRHHRKRRHSRGIRGFKINRAQMTTFAALAAGELLARYANKKLPDVIGKYSGALGGFAAYATPAAIIALALLAKKMSKGGQFVQLATNQAIGASIADAFSVAFPNVISGLGMDSPLQGGEYQYRLTEPNAAVPYPASLQGIPKINSYTAEPGNYREYAY